VDTSPVWISLISRQVCEKNGRYQQKSSLRRMSAATTLGSRVQVVAK
jgi:hypothetical protein